MDCKQICIDYIEGRLPYQIFHDLVMENDELNDWINSYANEIGMQSHTVATKENNWTPDQLPFSLRYQMEVWEKYGSFGNQLNIQGYLCRIFRHCFPEREIHPDERIEELCDLQIAACPEYIDGPEVWASGIIEVIMEECPKDLSKSKKVKYIKTRIKEVFGVEGSQYPRWIQNADWPVSNGRPLKFVRTVKKLKGEWKDHYFVDMETGEERIVSDFY